MAREIGARKPIFELRQVSSNLTAGHLNGHQTANVRAATLIIEGFALFDQDCPSRCTVRTSAFLLDAMKQTVVESTEPHCSCSYGKHRNSADCAPEGQS